MANKPAKHPGGRPAHNRITDTQKALVLEAIAKSGNYTIAAQHAGITRETIRQEAKRDKKFDIDIQSARDAYADVLEAILDKRLKNDNDKMGAILLMFALKANKPDKYRELSTVKHEGNIKIISGVPRPSNTVVKDITQASNKQLSAPVIDDVQDAALDDIDNIDSI
jgi:hypothetical protein